MEKNIPLMLDSTVLKQVPKLDSELFNQLVKYTRAGLYSLFIPEVVEREFITWAKVEAQTAFDTVTKATKSLSKFYDQPSILGYLIDFNATSLVAESQIKSILRQVVSNWAVFKEKTNATILPIQPDHAKVVMDAYFSGETPFRSVKHRPDIPDAFIFCTLKDLLKRYQKIVFVSMDKGFTERILSENIICVESLTTLFSTGPLKLDGRFFKSLKSDSKFFTLAHIYEYEIQRKLIREIELSDLSDTFADDLSSLAVGSYLDTSIKVLEINKKIDEAKNISDQSYLVSFEATLHCIVESTAIKSELLSISPERLSRIDKELDDEGDFKVSENYFFTVSGHFSLKFDDSDPSTWRERTKSGHFWEDSEIQEITVVLEDVQKTSSGGQSL